MCFKYLVASNSSFFLVPDGLPDRVGLPDEFGHEFHSYPWVESWVTGVPNKNDGLVSSLS
jgi:hypothetical protein